jgi:hypothetical protein
MGSTAASPTRVDREVYAAARAAAELTGRTIAEQLSHWARIGSEAEALALGALRDRRRSAAELLTGRAYDSLTGDEQAVVRVAWDAEMNDRLATLDLAAERRDAGLPVVTLDADGNVVRYLPDGSIERR